jgi:HAMP domain-containing protein
MKTRDSAVPLSFQQDSGMARRRRKARSEPAENTTNGSWSEHSNTKVLLNALAALKSGDFSVRLPLDWVGIAGKTTDTFNEVVALNQRMARELVRLHKSVGREGRINQRASLGEVEGTWAESVESVNDLIAELAQPTSEMARVIGAVAQGDLSQTMALEIEGRPLKGEFLRTARTVNTMVKQLSSFASEVTRVAWEVGTEGKLGRQEDIERSRVAGFQAHLIKPVSPQQLEATIDQLRNSALLPSDPTNESSNHQ